MVELFHDDEGTQVQEKRNEEKSDDQNILKLTSMERQSILDMRRESIK